MNLSISSNDIAILHTETTPRCSGYIIFEDATCQRVILVKTHKGNYSFPKGKREKRRRNPENGSSRSGRRNRFNS